MTAHPPNITTDQSRIYTLTLYFSLIGGFSHGANLIRFALNGITPLAYINIGSVTLFTCAFLLIRFYGKTAEGLVLMCTELIVHQAFAVYYLGWDYGFQYFLFAIPGFVFLGNFRKTIIPIGFGVVSTATFIWLLASGRYLLDPHLSGLEHAQPRYFWSNVVGSFLGLAIVSIMYTRGTLRIEKELERQNEELRQTQLRLVQSEKMAAIGKLAAGVTHEINTPIGAIISNTQTGVSAVKRIMQDRDKSDSEDNASNKVLNILRNSLDSTATASQRLGELVNRLNGFIQLDEAEVKPADIHEGIESTITLLQEQLQSASIEIIRNFDETIPDVTGRHAELNQVWMHLLQNAIDAIDGSGAITITTGCDEEFAAVSIGDTGRGLTPEECESLFDVGFSSDRSRVKMGMGLPVSHQIITRNRGSISVKSTPEQGSTFKVRIPM